jgi:hypothetical protein
MRIPRISEIDLARIAPLSRDEKFHHLWKLRAGRPPHTYNPLRSCVGDVLNLQPELFPGGEYTPWRQIEAEIARTSHSDSELKFNLAVAEPLYKFGLENEVLSYSKPTLPWAVGYGQSVSYWWNLYTVIGREACFIFIDPRLSAPLTALGKRFAFSLIHERLRVTDPDFANAKLLIAQFAKGQEGKRTLRLSEADDAVLYGFDALNEMIEETYKCWVEVLTERAKLKPTGSTPMGF